MDIPESKYQLGQVVFWSADYGASGDGRIVAKQLRGDEEATWFYAIGDHSCWVHEGLIDTVQEEGKPPAWTTVTPTEPGYYWWRKRERKVPLIAELVRSEMDNDPDPRLLWVGIDERIPGDGTYGSGEWWPIRIQEPPS